VARVKTLMADKPFDIRNPNRVRALIGAFAANPLRFHGADGAGYALVAQTLKQLDAINPQVAARMAAAFEAWRRYDSGRQEKMREQLKFLADGASPNLAEVTGRMLG
jgi:aminopeptidase N